MNSAESTKFDIMVPIAGFFVLLLIVLIAFTINRSSKVKKLTNTKSELTMELDKLNKDISNRNAELEEEMNVVVRESTGLDSRLIKIDKEISEEFFRDAFSWFDSKSYNKARNFYIEYLGENNSFTKTYMPEDMSIDVEDGKLSFIDFKELKVKMDDMLIVPLLAENDRIRYVAFVRYYSYVDDKDLVNKDALDHSDAIIKFTVIGESNGRKVSEVEAWSGFTANN